MVSSLNKLQRYAKTANRIWTQSERYQINHLDENEQQMPSQEKKHLPLLKTCLSSLSVITQS